MSQRLISLTEVRERVGLSKTDIYRKIAAGKFPKQVPLGTARVAFVESEIDAWIAERIEERDAKRPTAGTVFEGKCGLAVHRARLAALAADKTPAVSPARKRK